MKNQLYNSINDHKQGDGLVYRIPEAITIAIPYDLAMMAVRSRVIVNKYETNQLIKLLDTWLALKHITTSGKIKQWNDQKKFLLQVCKCTDTTFRYRINQLEEMKLLSFYKIERKNDSINVCSWKHFAAVLDIDITEKLTIQYNINDNKKLLHWIIAAEIQSNKNRQDILIKRKLSENVESKLIIDAALLRHGADKNKLRDFTYYKSRMMMLYLSDFSQLSEAHNQLIEIRPDNNRSVRGIAAAMDSHKQINVPFNPQPFWKASGWHWGYGTKIPYIKHDRFNKPAIECTEQLARSEWDEQNTRRLMVTVSYWKKQLSDVGIINVSKVMIKSQQRSRNKHCKVIWDKQDKETVLVLCDQIDLLFSWMRSQEFQIPMA